MAQLCSDNPKLMKTQGFAPTVITTGKLRSYGTAIAKLGLSAPHEQGLRRNNRAEVSHQPNRGPERNMQRFKSHRSAQQFLSMHATVYTIFNIQRHLIFRQILRPNRAVAMDHSRSAAMAA